MKPWTVQYDNDAGPDGGFAEWWTVTNGEKSFTAHSEADAKWLADVLNLVDLHQRP